MAARTDRQPHTSSPDHRAAALPPPQGQPTTLAQRPASGRRLDTPAVWRPVSRRAFLVATAYATAAIALARCAPTPSPTAPPSSSPSRSPSPSPSPPAGPFEALEELRAALRGSPDHLPATAERLVASRDARAIVRFVQERIATYPAGRQSPGFVLSGRRWGTRATLRGGAGTLRERADLLADLLRQAGFEAAVVELPESIEARALFVPISPPPFDPVISDERLRVLRTSLGLAPDPPGQGTDPDPRGASSAALADALIGALGEPPGVLEPFELGELRNLPGVRVVVDGTTYLATVHTSSDLQPAGPNPPGEAREAEPTLPVIVRLEAARSDAPSERFPLVEGRWSAEDVVGRTVLIDFLPPVEGLEELLSVRPRDVGVVTPILTVSGPDLSQEEIRRLSVAGEPITLAGERVTVRSDGQIEIEDRVLGGPVPDPERLAAVRSLEVVANPAGYPTVFLEVTALDASGKPVTGLPATAFTLTEETTGLGFLLERTSPPPPRILLLLDTSDSIPPAFRAEGAATLARRLAEELLAADPRVQLRVAAVTFDEARPAGDWVSNPAAIEQQAREASGFGSQLWEALADAPKLGPTTVVFITDGRATDGSVEIEEPPARPLARVEAGPPAVVIGVGDVAPAMLERLGRAGRLGAFQATAQDEALAAIRSALATPVPPYRFRYTALPAGPEERRVEVRLHGSGVDVAGTTTYRVPPAAERVTPPALSGLFLSVEVGRVRTERTLAGLRTTDQRAQVEPAVIEAVRRALFGRFVLAFEAAAPAPAVVLDEAIATLLALRPLVEAKNGPEALAALATLRYAPPPSIHALSVRLPADGGSTLTYEIGLRVTLHREVEEPLAEGRARRTRAVDILAPSRFATVDPDGSSAFRTTARRTARLALVESIAFPTSTRAALEGVPLVPIGRSIYSALEDVERARVDRLAAAVEPWRDLRGLLGLVPAAGTPTAAWLFDGETGTLFGVLADGSGGGSEVEEIEDTFERAGTLLDAAGLVSDIASFAGLGGFSLAGGVWLQLEKTKMEKLKAATIMLATLEAPRGDITDLSDLRCSVAQAVGMEAAGAVAGRLAGEAGERAVTLLGIADGIAGLARGEGFFC